MAVTKVAIASTVIVVRKTHALYATDTSHPPQATAINVNKEHALLVEIQNNGMMRTVATAPVQNVAHTNLSIALIA